MTLGARRKPDYFLFVTILFLIIFGLVMLASASSNLAETKFNDPWYYVRHQILYGALPGIVGFIVASLIPYQWYRKAALPLFIASLVLTILVFTPLGLQLNGATRWLSIAGVSFQPSEILKVTFVMYVAAWLSKGRSRSRELLKGLIPFLLMCAAIAAPLFLQHSTSIAVILLAAAGVLYFAHGAKWRYIFSIAAVSIIIFGGVIYFTGYRKARILNFLQPTANKYVGGYHLSQALNAIGTGGLKGVGYGQSKTKLKNLPEPMGDSIFAVIAEETGFIGATVLIAAYVALLARLFILAWRKRDEFGRLLLIGFATILGMQVFINIGAISGILPLTGMPLPFVSYGSTSLLVLMIMSGMIINISRRR